MSGPGRPSKYKSTFPRQAEKLARLGATDVEMADFFQVAESTWHKWRMENDRLDAAVRRGKLWSDANVADALYKRAIGYSHLENKVVMQGGKPVVVKVKKIHPPDTTAIIYWLKNRRRVAKAPHEPWQDKHEVEVEGGRTLGDISDADLVGLFAEFASGTGLGIAGHGNGLAQGGDAPDLPAVPEAEDIPSPGEDEEGAAPSGGEPKR